jgi:hypothetical protein
VFTVISASDEIKAGPSMTLGTAAAAQVRLIVCPTPRWLPDMARTPQSWIGASGWSAPGRQVDMAVTGTARR